MGVVEEPCAPYEAKNDVCHTNIQCAKHYTAYYRYVGGIYFLALHKFDFINMIPEEN